ncbi:MAG: WXG100 family type VII secretion target [Pseudobutyrivibrio sp.]|nr:WXG100 family type VII secretion target [Pseudobutyrivibrio sp.]
MGANGMIGGDSGQIAESGSKLVTFAGDLRDTLGKLRTDVDDVSAEGIFGDSAQTLIDVYNQLDADLHKYADTLENLGGNVKTSATNLEDIDSAHSSGLTYEG